MSSPGGGQQRNVPWAGALATAAMLASGTATAVLTKAAYELESVGLSGVPTHFEKPWALTATMFLGMALCLPVAYYQKYKQYQPEKGDGGGELSPVAVVFDAAEFRDATLLGIPAALDLVATGLMYIGLLSVTASVYQMLRGAMLVFAALFGTVFLKRRLNGGHTAGIVATLVGLGIVGAASLLSGEGSATRDVGHSEMVVGLLVCVAGQAVQAAQVTVEEWVMSQHGVAPVKVVGYEGVVGGALTVGLLLPLLALMPADAGRGLHEDTADTLVMLANNPTLAAVLVADLVAFCALNLSGMLVTQELGAVYKTLLETVRTLFVWLAGLGLYYTSLGGGVVGESWTEYSWMQLAGFLVLAGGTIAYRAGNQQQLAEQDEQQQADAMQEALLAEFKQVQADLSAQHPPAQLPAQLPAAQQQQPPQQQQAQQQQRATEQWGSARVQPVVVGAPAGAPGAADGLAGGSGPGVGVSFRSASLLYDPPAKAPPGAEAPGPRQLPQQQQQAAAAAAKRLHTTTAGAVGGGAVQRRSRPAPRSGGPYIGRCPVRLQPPRFARPLAGSCGGLARGVVSGW